MTLESVHSWPSPGRSVPIGVQLHLTPEQDWKDCRENGCSYCPLALGQSGTVFGFGGVLCANQCHSALLLSINGYLRAHSCTQSHRLVIRAGYMAHFMFPSHLSPFSKQIRSLLNQLLTSTIVNLFSLPGSLDLTFIWFNSNDQKVHRIHLAFLSHTSSLRRRRLFAAAQMWFTDVYCCHTATLQTGTICSLQQSN